MAHFNLDNSALQVVTRLDNKYFYDVETERVDEDNNSGFGINRMYVIKGGYSGTLLQELSNYLNFTYNLVMDTDSSTGLTYSFDKAANLSIDLFAASYSLFEDRALKVDPTFVIGASRVQVFINHRYESFMLELLLAPFQNSVWIHLLFLFTGIIIASGFIAYLREKVGVEDVVFQIISTCLQQDSKVNVRSYASLIVVCTVTFSMLIIHACFSGKMVSIAAVKRYSIDSLDEIVCSKFDIGFDVGLKNGSAIERIAKTLGKSPVMSKLLRKVRISNFRFDNFELSLREVENRPFAYIIDEETGFATIQRTIGHFPCDWSSISFGGIKYLWSMYMRKGSQFRPAINYGIQRLSETGNMRRLRHRWIPLPASGSASGTPRKGCIAPFTSIELRNLQAAFVLLSSFGLIALFILLVENLQRKNGPK